MKKSIFAIILFLASVVISMDAANIETLDLSTELMPSPMYVTVITPDGCDPDHPMPVVYLLNGYQGDHRQWLNVRPDLGQLADQYSMIMVMPDGKDSWYWDSPADPKVNMESWIVSELVPYIDRRYSTIADPKYRAITGLSMGGHGALWLAIRHLEIFGNVGSMSGAVDISGFVGKYGTTALLGDTKIQRQRWTDYSVTSLVDNLESGQLNIIIDCGAEDPFVKINKELHETLLSHKVRHDYISRSGGHSRQYWRNSILYHLLFFSQAFNKAD